MKQNTTYKQTELGLIPEDWEVKKLKDLGNTFTGLSGKNKDDFGEGFPYIPYKNIFQNSIIDVSFMDFVKIRANENQYKVKFGDLFFTTSSETAGEVGMCSVLLEHVENMYLNSFCFGFRLDDFKTLDPKFSSYLFRGEQIRQKITVLAQGSTRFNLSKSELQKLKIPLPPLPEQKKIADCLSTWDVAIEKQSALINALTDRKKALMQQLLTGKKRLPGFEGEWKEVKLGEVIKTFSGGTPKSTVKEYYIGDIPFIKSGEINSIQTEQFINEEAIKNSSAKKVIKGDLLYALYGATSGTVGISNLDGAINQAVLCIRTNENKFYLFYLLDHLKQNVINSFLQGGQGNLSSKIINELNVKLPSLSEQTAIAEILATADRELTLQKEKLAQLQTQKKGLMQVLLTGKKRLLN